MNPTWMTYGVLAVAIVLEVAGTTCLQLSQQFTRPVPTAIMAVCYLGAFYLVSLSLKTIPVGIAYAMWSGLGIVLISLISVFFLHQKLDAPAVLGLGFIVLGVIIVNVFSKSVAH